MIVLRLYIVLYLIYNFLDFNEFCNNVSIQKMKNTHRLLLIVPPNQ